MTIYDNNWLEVQVFLSNCRFSSLIVFSFFHSNFVWVFTIFTIFDHSARYSLFDWFGFGAYLSTSLLLFCFFDGLIGPGLGNQLPLRKKLTWRNYNSKFDVCLSVSVSVFVFLYRVLPQRRSFSVIAWSVYVSWCEARHRLHDWFVFGVVSLSTSLRFFFLSMVWLALGEEINYISAKKKLE